MVLNCLDLLLDPIYSGCGTTGLDAMAVGVPVVTMSGLHSRGRIMAGIYKGMGIENPPIALDTQEYISWCKTIASSKTLRDELKISLSHAYSRFCKINDSTVPDMVAFFYDAVKSSMANEILPPKWKANTPNKF